MPEVHSQSVHKSHNVTPQPRRQSRRRTRRPRRRRLLPLRPLRRHIYRQLMCIQINTAGLSGPYRSDEETMERVIGNHRAVREVRRLLRRSLLIPRTGPLWQIVVAASLSASGGDAHKAARLLGTTAEQLRQAWPTSPIGPTH